MYADIVIPQDNEEQFLKMCRVLGYSRIYFAYDSETTKDLKRKIKETIERFAGNEVVVHAGVRCLVKEVNKFSAQSDFVMVKSSDNDRPVIEKTRPDILYDLEYKKKSDFMHNKNSGLNHVMAKIASKNGVSIGVRFSKLINSSSNIRAKTIPRIKQNIVLCRKNKARIYLFSLAKSPYLMRAPADVISYLKLLGMTVPEAKHAMHINF